MKSADFGRHDAIVIGASVGGLVAAAYLAAAGKRVLVLERQAAPPEPIGPVYALDPLVLSELRLSARGLRFVNRDLSLALPGLSGELLFLGRNNSRVAHSLGAFSAADAVAWKRFRRDVDGMARELRRWWWSLQEEGAADWVLSSTAMRDRFARLSLTGADAFLATYFESEAVMAALLFDASAGGFHVSEPGSALALVWRAAQQMTGLDGAAAMPAPGTLIWSLIKAAGASDFRCCATVSDLLIRDGAVAGVRLSDGEEIEAGIVLSSARTAPIPRRSGVLPQREIGEMRLLITLREKVAFPSARLILAGHPGIYADAYEAARDGRIGAELPMEFAAAAGQAGKTDKIAVTLRPVPARPSAEDRIQLAARAVQALSRQIPGAARLVSDVRLAPSAGRATLERLLAPSLARVTTGIGGLYLCGAGAEPLASQSGRAARIAVGHALKFLTLYRT